MQVWEEKTAAVRQRLHELEEPYRNKFISSRKFRFPKEYQTMYDLSADIAEAYDLSAARPAVVAELTRLYEQWAAGLQPPRWRDLLNPNAPGPGSGAARQDMLWKIGTDSSSTGSPKRRISRADQRWERRS